MLAILPAAPRGALSRCGSRAGPMLRAAALLALAAIPVALAPAAHAEVQAQTKATVKASYFKLANGMEVVVVPNHRVPVVTHQVWYKSGAAEDPDDQPGVAQLKRWGLLDKVRASNCPPIPKFTLDIGPFAYGAGGWAPLAGDWDNAATLRAADGVGSGGAVLGLAELEAAFVAALAVLELGKAAPRLQVGALGGDLLGLASPHAPAAAAQRLRYPAGGPEASPSSLPTA